MSRVTVVIEGATAPIHLNMPLAGGRLTSAHLGDLSEYHELLGMAKDLLRAASIRPPMPYAERLAILERARPFIEKLEAE